MNRILQEDAKSYLLSGRASVIVHNTQPSNPTVPSRYIFQIKRKKPGYVWYVYYNNEYIGYITNTGFLGVDAPRINIMYKRQRAAFAQLWLWITTQTLPDHIELYHTGKCGHCGRRLTDEDSRRKGIGPECARKLGIVNHKTSALTE